MVRLVKTSVPVLMIALLALPSVADARKCKRKGKKPQVFVKPNTPLRRGPGLNYQVADFLERGICAPFSEVSMDRQWILVDLGSKLGWVERTSLSSWSQELVAKAGAGDAPIGSGSRRSFIEATKQVTLMARPSTRAEPKSILPEGTRFLPFAITTDGVWVQVRDERSEIGWVMAKHVRGPGLAGLPKTNEGFDQGVVTKRAEEMLDPEEDPAPPQIVETPVPPGGDDDGSIHLTAAAFGAALAPVHSMSSNSDNGYRTYDLSSFSGGAAVEVGLTDLGPIALRLGYQFAMLGGISHENNPNIAVSGFQHDAQLRIGLPLAAGPLLVTPELGYAFGIFDFDTALPGTAAQFISTTTNAGLGGLRLQFFASQSVLIDLEGAFLFGVTAEGPQRLGDAGFTMGTHAGAGIQFLVSELVSVAVRYHVSYRTTPFTGPAPFDSTVTEATLTDLSHGLLLGVGFNTPL